MINSMTGHGRAVKRKDGLDVEAEVKSVNNRFLKVNYKLPELLGCFEPHFDQLLREKIKRGTIQVLLRVSGDAFSGVGTVSEQVLAQYIASVVQANRAAGILLTMELGSVLQLPGVLVPPQATDQDLLGELAFQALQEALLQFNRMRASEGEQMGFELRNILAKVTSWCREIENRAPGVLVDYRRRLEGRVRSTLTELGHATAEVEVLREVVLFSDRSDIREEVVRLSSHLEQVGAAIQEKESQGKRLDFLIQEMVRETNTIGSKANDSAISHFVVEIKTAIEQMREIVQNVE